MKQCDLAVFADRCFEGYQEQRPVRLLDFQPVDKTVHLLMKIQNRVY